jgi:hypothetical protein
LPLWVIPILMVALVGFIAWAIQPPQIEASLSPAPQIIGQPAKLKWNTTNARQVLILPLNITAEAAGGEFTFADSTSIPANLRVEASTLFGVQRTAVPTVYVLAPTATPVATPVPPTLTPLPTLEPLPTLAPQPPGPALPTLAPLPTAPPLPTATLPPAEIVATIKDCRAGVRVLITGSGPAQAPYLLFFGRRAVAGGSVAANGRFQTSLLIGKERPGTYPVTVRQRLSDRLLLMQSYQLGTTDPVVLPPTFNDGSPINIICVVPTVLPTPTVGPAAAP